MDIPSLVGGLGIGVLLATLVDHVFKWQAAQRDRRNRELKEAYSGFLQAISQVRSDKEIKEADVNLRYWVARVQLVCSKEILELLWSLEGKKRASL